MDVALFIRIILYGCFILVSLAMVGIALLLMTADARRNWNQILALFCVLIGLNFFAQALRIDFLLRDAGYWLFSDATIRIWERIGGVTLIMDPPVLAYFVSIFPRRTRLARGWIGPAVLGVVTLFFLYHELEYNSVSGFFSRTGVMEDPVGVLFWLWMAVLYLYSVLRIVLSYFSEPSRIMGRQVHFIALGLMIALLPRIALALSWDPGFIRIPVHDGVVHLLILSLLVYPLVLWGTFGLIVLWAFRRAREVSRQKAREYKMTLWFVAGALGFFHVLTTTHILHASGSLEAFIPPDLPLIGQSGWAYSLRWILFTVVVFYGIVRFQVLAVHPRMVRTLLVAVVLIVVAVVAGFVAERTDPWSGTLLPMAAGAIAAVLFYRLVRERERIPRSGYLHRRALDAYASTLAAALAEGPLTPKKRDHLEKDRKRLGISRREYELLHSVAAAEQKQGGREVLLGRFEQVRVLGSGSYATVHLARDPEDPELVAVKMYEEGLTGKEALDASRRELEVARQVSHPNLLSIHEVVTLPKGMVVVMEFASGGSLRDRLLEDGALPPSQVKRLAEEMLSGLEALHETGLVHGDLKPANILFDADGSCKLADFGSAGRPRDVRGRRSGTLVAPGPGTYLYMAPEVSTGRTLGPQSDLFSVGCILVEALTGRSPKQGDTVPRWDQIVEPVPFSWVQVLQKALAARPRDRFPSAASMRAAIRDLPDEEGGVPWTAGHEPDDGDQTVRRRPGAPAA